MLVAMVLENGADIGYWCSIQSVTNSDLQGTKNTHKKKTVDN